MLSINEILLITDAQNLQILIIYLNLLASLQTHQYIHSSHHVKEYTIIESTNTDLYHRMILY